MGSSIHTYDIVCKNLFFSYDGKKVFENVSFRIASVGLTALLGPSGVGKTTLAKILSGIINGWYADELTLPQRVLYCHNQERLPVWQTVGTHLKEITSDEKRTLLDSLIDSCSLTNRILKLYPYQLSSGQSNRINLILYLIQDFDILILDEALSNVDEKTRHKVLSILKCRFSEKGFIYISHQLKEIALYSCDIFIIRDFPTRHNLNFIKGLDITCHTDIEDQQINDFLKKIITYV